MIAVTGLRKAFGAKQALNGVTFSAGDGEVVGLLGSNGAGKTTALRIISTILEADSGRAAIDGHDSAQSAEEVRRRLGAVSTGAGLYPRLTAREHITYFGELHGMQRDVLEARTAELARELDMEALLDRRVAGFSQGEKLKVNIARALIHDPKNVLLDEPTNGLDVPATRAMREIIKQLKAQNRCVIVSTHIMQEVAAVCDRIVIVANGAVVAQGTKNELLTQTSMSSLEDAFVRLVQ